MHSFITESTAFSYNSDLSGDVEIMRLEDESKVSVPGVALLVFVAELVKSQRIGELEEASFEDVLGAKFPGLDEGDA